MFNLDKFYLDSRSLSNSLVIKINDIGKVMETAYIMPLKLHEYDHRNFRYFKHLKGEYYVSPKEYGYNPPYKDREVLIKVIETEETQVLTKDLLEQYQVTKKELLKQGDYYTDLVDNNPDMITFIHGCLFPTSYTIDELLDLPDGTIIGYNDTLIEPQEYDLILKLENYIKDVIGRWHVSDYLIGEELYLHSMLGVLYGHLPNKIINIRLNNIRTHQVHSFFLEAYFNSKFYLWDNIKSLKQETIIWLYLNLDYISKHIGRNEIFKLLVNKVFAENNVGIGEYIIQAEDPTLNDKTTYDLFQSPLSSKIATVEKRKLNSKFLYDNNDNISIDETLKKEFELTNRHPKDHVDYLIGLYKKDINANIRDTNKTKILEISTLKTFYGYGVDTFQILFDYWTYLLSHNLYGSFYNDDVVTAKIDFIDPNTGIPYNITSRGGYYILLYVLLHNINATEIPLDKLDITTVLDKDVNIEDILKKSLFQDGYTELHHSYLIDNYPVPNRTFTSNLDVAKFLDSVLHYYRSLWILNANSENAIVSANFREFLFMASFQASVKIHNREVKQTIKELLNKEGIKFSIIDGIKYDYIATIKELFNSCLGVVIDSVTELQQFLKNLKEIQRKLTSYTLQTFGDISSGDEHYIYYNTNCIFNSQKGLIDLKKDVLEIVSLCDDYFQSLFLVLSPENDLKTWGSNNRLNSKLIENIGTLGRVEIYTDQIYVSCSNEAAYDLKPYRNTISPSIYPNHDQVLLYLKDVKIVDGDTEYRVSYNRGNYVDQAGVVMNKNDASIKNKGYVRGTAKVMFDDDTNSHDTSLIEKDK